MEVEIIQSNDEAEVVAAVADAHARFDALLINPSGFTVAEGPLPEAIGSLSIPAVEVHASNPAARGVRSTITPACAAAVCGFGYGRLSRRHAGPAGRSLIARSPRGAGPCTAPSNRPLARATLKAPWEGILMSEAIDDANAWRTETPGCEGWPRTARPDDANKFFMVSADGHVQEPSDLWATRMDDVYRERLPGVIMDGKGNKLQKTEGFRPLRLQNTKFEGEDLLRNQSGKTPEDRVRDLALDGVEGGGAFPEQGSDHLGHAGSGLLSCHVPGIQRLGLETFAGFNDRLAPMACVAPGALAETIAEIQRCAALGFKGLSLPCKPVWGPPDHTAPNYNLPEFDELWACIQDVDLPVTFHVSTGRDPRTARGNGGAVINYAVHSLAPTMEPIANLCASGVLDRYPRIVFGTIEAGIGWVAWALGSAGRGLPEASHVGAAQARPSAERVFQNQRICQLPGRQGGTGSGPRARAGGATFLWANDFPHHEGTWPHSAAAIERTMGAPGRCGAGEDPRAECGPHLPSAGAGTVS